MFERCANIKKQSERKMRVEKQCSTRRDAFLKENSVRNHYERDFQLSLITFSLRTDMTF